MADVDLNFSCGCGYKTHSLEAAEMHSDSANHKMTILGAVKPTITTSTRTPAQVQRQTKPEDNIDVIQSLRARINGTK